MKNKLLLLFLSIIAVVAACFALSACSNAEEITGEPQNISYDGSYITWDRVIGVNYYTVSIDGGEPARSNSTTYSYVSSDTFEVTVTSVFEGYEASSTVTFKPLATISALYVSDSGVVSWDAVAGANAYMVSVNGQTFTTTDTAYDELPAGSNRVRVRPIVSGDNTYYSSYSAESSVYIYSVPSNIKYDGTTLSWSGNSSSYNVRINGVDNAVTGTTMNYNANNNDFTVQIKALGNHESTYDSATAEEDFHYLDPVTELIVENGVIKWNAVADAEGYKVMVNNVERTTVTKPEYDQLPTGSSQDVAVLPVNQSGNYFSSWSAVKTVYILETPSARWNNDLELDGEENNNFIWDAVNAAGGYTVRVTYNGNLVDEYSYSDLQRSYANAYAQVGVYTVEVKANAQENSADYYDSKYSTPITVERLAAPEAATNNFIVSNSDSLSSGFTVNYTQVSGASGYQLYKDGVALEGRYSTGTAITDNNASDPTIMTQQNYTYIVRSMGGMRITGGQTYVTLPCLTANALSFNITVQATPQNPRMNGYSLLWDTVSGVNGYVVNYAGNTNTAQTESFDLSILNPGTYSVTVNSRGNGSNVLASNLSTPVEIQRLQAPTDIVITSAENGTLDWTDVSHADGYSAYLDLSQTPLNTDAYDNMYQYITTAGTTVSMTANANYYNDDNTVYYMTSPVSPTQQFIRLSAPTFPEGAVANSTELIWNAPSNINTSEYTPTYEIYSAIGELVGGSMQNATRFNIEYLEGGREHTFYVKAIGNDTKYLDSDYSAVFTVYKLATPEIVIDNNQYTWTSIVNAGSYIMTIDGVTVSDEFHVAGSTYTYTPRYTTTGDHIVTLTAVGDGRYTINSSAYRYTQKTAILDTPEITFGYSDESYVPNGSITVNITQPVDNCVRYQYEIAGETVTSEQLSYTKTILSTGSYVIRVLALGGVIDENEVYYIDSLPVGGNNQYSITLLGAPLQTSFSITADGAIKWNAVSGSFGYDYQISFNGGEFSDIQHTPYTSPETIQNYRQYQSITIRVRASGNVNGTVISSQWVEWTWTNSGYAG